MKEHQMYPHNPSSAESILNEKMSDISHAWLDDQRVAVIEAMKEHASNEVAKYKTVIEKLLPLAVNYEIRVDMPDWEKLVEDKWSIIAEANKLIKS